MVNDYISLNLDPVEGIHKKSYWRVSTPAEHLQKLFHGVLGACRKSLSTLHTVSIVLQKSIYILLVH